MGWGSGLGALRGEGNVLELSRVVVTRRSALSCSSKIRRFLQIWGEKENKKQSPALGGREGWKGL